MKLFLALAALAAVCHALPSESGEVNQSLDMPTPPSMEEDAATDMGSTSEEPEMNEPSLKVDLERCANCAADADQAEDALDRSTLKRRKTRPGKAPGGGISPAKIFQELCDEPDTIEVCDFSTKFRSFTGECNNLIKSQYGAVSTAFRRLVPAAYADGSDEPRGTYRSALDTCKKTGNNKERNFPGEKCKRPADALLPNARRVSAAIHPNNDVPDRTGTLIVMQMGQFLDHDLTLAPEEEFEGNEIAECCSGAEDGNFHEGCFPVISPCGDEQFLDRASNTAADKHLREECRGFLPVARSLPFCEGNTTVREQFNAITAFVDASNVYGSDEEGALALRARREGLLATTEGELLPFGCGENVRARVAGDVRAVENPGLASMHTLFVREHNRIARAIADRKHDMSDEEIYNEARRINIAQMQNVVYNQYVRELVGDDLYESHNLKPTSSGSSYDIKVDPSITQAFSTAAYRFGHSMIQDLVLMISSVTKKRSSFLLKENFDNMTLYEEDMDALMLGMITQRAQTFDKNVASAVTENLFANKQLSGDLVVRNIQRAREHGIAGYNEYREHCGLPRACSWDEAPDNIRPKIWQELSTLYDHPSDIDLFTAGLVEDQISDGHVGATFGCLLAEQFEKLRFGDRFFYTHNPADDSDRQSSKCSEGGAKFGIERNPNPFTKAQLNNLLSRNLGDIMCDNTNLAMTRTNVFRSDSSPISCGRGDVRGSRRARKGLKKYSQLDISLFF